MEAQKGWCLVPSCRWDLIASSHQPFTMLDIPCLVGPVEPATRGLYALQGQAASQGL